MLAVLGPYGSGTRCVAGVLHCLGINMGAVFPANGPYPMGSFEAEGLARLCRRIFQEPWLVDAMSCEDRASLLRRWAAGRCDELRGHSPKFAGGQHPILSLLGADLLAAWNKPIFVVVDRPVEDSIRAVLDAGWNWPQEAVRYSIPKMVAQREAFLRDLKPPHVRVALQQLGSDPVGTILQLCKALDYAPDEGQLQTARAFVDTWFGRHESS